MVIASVFKKQNAGICINGVSRTEAKGLESCAFNTLVGIFSDDIPDYTVFKIFTIISSKDKDLILTKGAD